MQSADVLMKACDELVVALSPLRFRGAITHVYNPLIYARTPYEQYVRKYATTKKRVVFLGMNPGPFGMSQTGVPFGEVALVRDWLGIEAKVERPTPEHPKRPVEGFACKRSEVSGARLWGAFATRFGDANRFFRHAFVANYCPLVFMETSGKNFTPDKLPVAERSALYQACDDHLRKLVCALEPSWVIGIGAFATERARAALSSSEVRLGTVLHPSPASPAANAGWADKAFAQLEELGVLRLL
jgi:single-strand selective monofunctional uracil DNA glycosylase